MLYIISIDLDVSSNLAFFGKKWTHIYQIVGPETFFQGNLKITDIKIILCKFHPYISYHCSKINQGHLYHWMVGHMYTKKSPHFGDLYLRNWALFQDGFRWR